MDSNLTKTEQRIVDALKQNENSCTDYNELIPDYSERSEDRKTLARRSLSVHICSIKKKLAGIAVIDSVTSKGYIYKPVTGSKTHDDAR